MGPISDLNVMVCTDVVAGCSLEGLIASVRSWKSSDAPPPKYTLPVAEAVSRSDLHHALASLLDTREVEGQENFVEGIATDEPWKSPLQEGFARRGQGLMVRSSDAADRFQLTQAGLRQLQIGAVYTDSRPLFEVRAELPASPSTNRV